jgi:hypothetical protein
MRKKIRKKKYVHKGESKFAPYLCEELDGLTLGQTIWWLELDDNIYTGYITKLIEHPEYGNIITCYCRKGGYRSKSTSEVSAKKVRRKRKNKVNIGKK